jgi:YD repeat-containing protein
MGGECKGTTRFFVTYSGVKLPFKLVNQLEGSEVENRNTYFRGCFDAQDRLTGFEKIAYGEAELIHRYEYHDNGKLKQAEITDIDGETTVLEFDAEGNPG